MKILAPAFRLKAILAAGLLLGAGSLAYADGTIFLEVGKGYGESNPYQYADGGEFTALTTGLPSTVPAGYSSSATFKVGDITGFETFCIEDQVDFYVGTTYHYTEGMDIQQTGGKLSAGAAWLYEQFAKGILAGYDYNTGNDKADAAKRLADAGLLQATLWALQGEPQDSNDPFDDNSLTNPFLADIDARFGNLTNAKVNANSSYGVEVLELTGSNGGIAQDQLIYTGGNNVPDDGTTALLLGASLLGLAFLRRRSRRLA